MRLSATREKAVGVSLGDVKHGVVKGGCQAISWASRRAGKLPPSDTSLFETRIWWGILRGKSIAMPSLVRPSMALGTYERYLTRKMRKYVKPGDVTYDIGASFGYHALALATLVGERGRVIAFEPTDADRQVLEHKPARNDLRQVEIRREAIGDHSGTARFAMFEYSLVNRVETGAGESDARFMEVPLVSLDDFVYEQGNPAPSFIKCAVTRGEGEVIAGAARLLKEARPVVVIESGYGAPFARIEETIAPLGYTATRLLESSYSEWRSKFILLPPGKQPPRRYQ
jgi:FkbM family methyltransferase